MNFSGNIYCIYILSAVHINCPHALSYNIIAVAMAWSSDIPLEIRHMTETKRLAEKVIADKHALVEVDKRRQDMRQASRALNSQAGNETVTLMTGSVMIKLHKDHVQKILKKDLIELDTESNRLRSELKEEVSLLHEFEMKDPLQGFDLKALSRPEMAAVGQVLGRSSLQ